MLGAHDFRPIARLFKLWPDFGGRGPDFGGRGPDFGGRGPDFGVT
jgi:hypothetical protein